MTTFEHDNRRTCLFSPFPSEILFFFFFSIKKGDQFDFLEDEILKLV